LTKFCFNPISGACTCDSVEIVSTRADVMKKHSQLLGRYNRRNKEIGGGEGAVDDGGEMAAAEENGGRPTYQHFSGRFFLYYNVHSQGFWAVGERMNAGKLHIKFANNVCMYSRSVTLSQ
jgi:hypothetical protein